MARNKEEENEKPLGVILRTPMKHGSSGTHWGLVIGKIFRVAAILHNIC